METMERKKPRPRRSTYEASEDGTRQAFVAMSTSMSRRRRGETGSMEYTEDERRRATGS